MAELTPAAVPQTRLPTLLSPSRLAPTVKPMAPSRWSAILIGLMRATILLALAIGVILIILFALVPAVVVAVLLFVPALLPLLLLGLGILATSEPVATAKPAAPEPCQCEADLIGEQPCQCEADVLARTLR